jgi:hypothetical protein
MALTLDRYLFADLGIGFDHNQMADDRIVADLNPGSNHTIVADKNIVSNFAPAVNDHIISNGNIFANFCVHRYGILIAPDCLKSPLVNIFIHRLPSFLARV